MPEAIRLSGIGVATGDRLFRTATVAASPADATETVIASLAIGEDIAIGKGILVSGFAAFTVGTNGTNSNLRIRRTSVAGTILKATGALTTAAAALFAPSIVVLDTGGALPNQTYVLTLTVTAATAASTVSAVELIAEVV